MGKLWRRMAALAHRRRMERELEEEMAAHREMMPSERQGNFGSTLRLREEAAEQWGFAWIDQLRQDVAYGARSLRRAPGFAFTAIAVLALGIGVNLAEVHIFDAVLHRLHVRDVGSLCRFYRVTRQGTVGDFSVPEVEFYRRNNTALSSVITETEVQGIRFGQDSVDMRMALVSGNFFAALGIVPVHGRVLEQQDDRPDASPVAVLGYDYWQSRFGGDPRIMMQTVRLNDKPVQVVGIAPPEFGGLARYNVNAWMTLAECPYLTGSGRMATDYGVRRAAMFGRLKPGVSFEAVEAQFRALAAELRKQQPAYVERGEWLKAMPPEAPPRLRPADLLLYATFILLVLLVLLSACANLGNMLLARGLARQREIAIRLAVGAGRKRVLRQLMTENLLLAFLATAAALLVGKGAASLTLKMISAPSDLRVIVDWRIVLAAVVFGVGATLAFGLTPALQVVKGGPKATRARRVLVSVQVAASCVLLILSSYFVRSIQRGFHGATDFDYSGLALVDPLLYRHYDTAAEARRAAMDIAERLRQMPGVEGAAIATDPPLVRGRLDHVLGQQIYWNEVDAPYFSLMHLTVLAGRIFGPGEPDGAVISQSAARRLWPNQSPLGKTLAVAQSTRTVTGVVQDSGVNLARYPDSIEVYVPVGDADAPYATVLVRAKNPIQMAMEMRSAATVRGGAPLVMAYSSLVEQYLEPIRKMMKVVGALAGIASLLALIGMFGLLAFTVAQRTREIGVRMALGARGGDVLRIVLGQYAVPFGVGAAGGVALAAAAARVLHRLVFGYASLGVMSVGMGLAVFSAVALVASIAPARRALRVDPAAALRWE